VLPSVHRPDLEPNESDGSDGSGSDTELNPGPDSESDDESDDEYKSIWLSSASDADASNSEDESWMRPPDESAAEQKEPESKFDSAPAIDEADAYAILWLLDKKGSRYRELDKDMFEDGPSSPEHASLEMHAYGSNSDDEDQTIALLWAEMRERGWILQIVTFEGVFPRLQCRDDDVKILYVRDQLRPFDVFQFFGLVQLTLFNSIPTSAADWGRDAIDLPDLKHLELSGLTNCINIPDIVGFHNWMRLGSLVVEKLPALVHVSIPPHARYIRVCECHNLRSITPSDQSPTLVVENVNISACIRVNQLDLHDAPLLRELYMKWLPALETLLCSPQLESSNTQLVYLECPLSGLALHRLPEFKRITIRCPSNSDVPVMTMLAQATQLTTLILAYCPGIITSDLIELLERNLSMQYCCITLCEDEQPLDDIDGYERSMEGRHMHMPGPNTIFRPVCIPC
jgi:hypothetical protein